MRIIWRHIKFTISAIPFVTERPAIHHFSLYSNDQRWRGFPRLCCLLCAWFYCLRVCSCLQEWRKRTMCFSYHFTCQREAPVHPKLVYVSSITLVSPSQQHASRARNESELIHSVSRRTSVVFDIINSCTNNNSTDMLESVWWRYRGIKAKAVSTYYTV